jgi:hypothetical protein
MKLARVAGIVALIGSAGGCGACEPNKTPPPSPSASASAAPPPASLPSARPPRPQPKLACRAITVEGDVHVEPAAGPAADAGLTPVLLQGLAPTEAWVGLAKGARLVVKDPRTTRETSLRGVPGPARARVCVGFAEESWVTAGRFESSVGAGEAPGAEEWIVTPFGVVRYGAAKITVDVQPRDAEVKLESGVAFAWMPVAPTPADAGLEDGWVRLAQGTSHLQSHEPAGGADAARTALDRCKTLAASARALAAQVMSPQGVDGGTIAAQVSTRRLARASCAVATLRVHALPEADAAPLLRSLGEANASWSAVPVGGSPSPP